MVLVVESNQRSHDLAADILQPFGERDLFHPVEVTAGCVKKRIYSKSGNEALEFVTQIISVIQSGAGSAPALPTSPPVGVHDVVENPLEFRRTRGRGSRCLRRGFACDPFCHENGDFGFAVGAAESIQGSQTQKNIVQIRSDRRAARHVVGGAPQQFAPKMQKRRPSHGGADRLAIGRQQQLPELIWPDRVKIGGISRQVIDSVLLGDLRQHERTDGAPGHVDIDDRLGLPEHLDEYRVIGRQPHDRVVDQRLAVSFLLAAENDLVGPEIGLRQANDVGVDPTATGLANHIVTEAIGKRRDRRLPGA